MIQANQLISNYEITPFGLVINKKTARVLKPDTSNGYASVVLSNCGHKKKFLIHRLVAQIYLPNPENKPCVNHKNGIKIDNSVQNLEWCTYSENEKHSHYVLGKKIVHSEETKHKMSLKAKGRDTKKAVEASAKKRKGIPALNRVTVHKYSLTGDYIKTYNSMSEASVDVNGTASAFSALKRGRLKTYKKFLWKFEN